MLGTQGSLPGIWISAVAFRDMDGDSRGDYAVIDWNTNQLGVGIQTGGYKNLPSAEVGESRGKDLREFKWANREFTAAAEGFRQFSRWSQSIASLDRRNETIHKVGRSIGKEIHAQLRETPHRGGRQGQVHWTRGDGGKCDRPVD